MPELPEVYTIATDLNSYIKDYVITDLRIARGYIALPDNDTFIKEVKNQKIEKVSRIAKNILIHLENKKIIQIHLGMTGRMLLRSPKQQADRWVRILFKLENKLGTKILKFCDMRTFGKVVLLKTTSTLKNKYGPEPVDENLNTERFLEILKSKKTTIKNALLTQELISGVGNIYATDALFIAKIHPETLTKNLSYDDAINLLKSLRKVLNEGIKNRGSTLSDKMYVDIFGREGKHQNFFRIYSKIFCPTCKSKVVYKTINGRGTYFCPSCQKKK
jgi:formamidopyrimidine-DNA glycosylase